MANQVPESQYHAYFKTYIKLVEDIPLNKALMSGMFKVAGFYESLSEENWSHRYADGKWTPKEILLHTIDTERIFCSRALQIARSENSILSGFDENLFADNSFANERSPEDLINEYISVRTATVSLFKSFSEKILDNTGIANEKPLSAQAAGYIICGHEQHHINIIKERYL
tara:strand:- start:1162 stop:1674 length:513 start_codon:yes stop_codon:yes gene_type:complete